MTAAPMTEPWSCPMCGGPHSIDGPCRERCECCDRVLVGVPAPDALYPSICEDCWDEECATAHCEITGVDK